MRRLDTAIKRAWRKTLFWIATMRRKYRNWINAQEHARQLAQEHAAELRRLAGEYEARLQDQEIAAQSQIEGLYTALEYEQMKLETARAAMRDSVSLILTHMQFEMLDLPDESSLEALEAVTPWDNTGADDDTGNPHILALFGFAPSSFTTLSRRHYRRGLEYGRTEHPSPLELYQLWCRHVYPVCAYSGLPLTPEQTQLEHIVPLSAGGENAITNMVFVHGDLNASKGNKILDVWAQRSRLDRDWLGRRVEHIRLPSQNGIS